MHEISILGPMTGPDSSGEAFFEPAEAALTLGTATYRNARVGTILAPTGSDIGFSGMFTIPQNYFGTPILVIHGVLGEAANILAFGFQQVSIAHSETFDVAYEAEDLANNATWTGLAAEEMYEETIIITPAAPYVAGDEVPWWFFRDDSVDTQTGEFHITNLLFRYNDA
jgi:hypothetical protein